MDSGKNHHQQLHICLFPFMAQGHIIPFTDLAKLLSTRGLKVSMITTPVNAPRFSKLVERTKALGNQVELILIKFPCAEAGLPEGCENLDMALQWDLNIKFFDATDMLDQPLEHALEKHRPDCLVADMFFTWATPVAAKFGIPRIVFHGTGFFSLGATESLRLYKPYNRVSSETEPFVVPDFPGEVKLTRSILPDWTKDDKHIFFQSHADIKESEIKSYGVIVNSFYELEPAYADHYRKVLGRKAWHLGPLFLANSEFEDKAHRGKEASINELECLKWLDTQKPKSVVYLCFGSLTKFTSSQLLEIAMGLEYSGLHFLWVVKSDGKEEWLPEGYEKRMEGKGRIVRGWAPQLLVLEHEAVGGFVCHCGWNSVLEGVSAGLPFVTWPVCAEQFYNEKLVTEILKIGVAVGIKQWTRVVGDAVKKEAVAKAITRIMVGQEAEELRGRVRALGDMAKRAIEEGGSSHSDLSSLIEELKAGI